MEVQKYRKAGGLESYCIYSNELDQMALVAVSARYSINITREILYPALAEVIKSEPLLGVNVFKRPNKGKKKRFFRKISTINLDQVVQFLPEQSLESFCDEFFTLKTPYFDDALPLWRIFVLGDREVVWGFNHGPFDGNSGSFFHERLVKQLGVVTSLENPIVPTSDKPIPPALTGILSIQPSFGLMIKLLFKLVTKQLSPRSNVWLGSPAAKPVSFKTVVASLDPEETSILIKRSKELKLSVSFILAACWIQTVLRELPKDKEGASINFNLIVDLRRFMDAEYAMALGNWVAQYEHSVSNVTANQGGNVFAEAMARDFSASLYRELSKVRSEMTSLTAFLDKIDIKDYLTHASRTATAELSNLGAKSMEGEKCRVEDMTFFQGCTSILATYTLSTVSVKGGRLNIAIAVALDDEKKSAGTRLKSHLLEALRNV
jgi:Alcohol acetyltransferase